MFSWEGFNRVITITLTVWNIQNIVNLKKVDIFYIHGPLLYFHDFLHNVHVKEIPDYGVNLVQMLNVCFIVLYNNFTLYIVG